MKRFAFVMFFLAMLAVLAPTLSQADDLDKVREAIRASGAQWTAGPAWFDEDDLRARLGVNKPLELELLNPVPLVEMDIPSSLDWRNEGAVTVVKDQEYCGGCWAFSVVGALESAAIREGGYPQSIDLSEQFLISDCYSQYDCNGSYSMWEPAQFLVTTGTVDEACFPFLGHDSSCTPCANYTERLYTAASRASVTQTVDQLKQALYSYGPLITAMNVYSDFNYYDDGVYSYAWGSLEGGHAVLIVGYNDAGQYFICKNSWSPYWGENGYFRIAYSQVNGVVDFGQDTQRLSFDEGGTQPSGQAPVLSYLRYYDADDNLLYPPLFITPADSADLVIAFDYEDGDNNLNNGIMYVTLDGDQYYLDLPNDMGNEGGFGFSFGEAQDLGYHEGTIYLVDTANNQSNQVEFSFTVQSNPQPCADNHNPQIIATHYFIETVELQPPVEVQPGVELQVWFEYADADCNLPGGSLFIDGDNLGTNPFFLDCSTAASGLYWGFYYDLDGATPGDYSFEAYFTDICGAQSNHVNGSFSVTGSDDDDDDDDATDDDDDDDDDASDDDGTGDDDDASDDDNIFDDDNDSDQCATFCERAVQCELYKKIEFTNTEECLELCDQLKSDVLECAIDAEGCNEMEQCLNVGDEPADDDDDDNDSGGCF